ncbi:MAG: hypothetical protein QNJ70_28735 [Xenococcaceae cyanobacterium MO_207.B15]|nr:hypothetical protein [Xenococcaceae cyanobacterium MO_207.B15]
MQTSNNDAVVPIDTTVEISPAYSKEIALSTQHNRLIQYFKAIAKTTSHYQAMVGGES